MSNTVTVIAAILMSAALVITGCVPAPSPASPTTAAAVAARVEPVAVVTASPTTLATTTPIATRSTPLATATGSPSAAPTATALPTARATSPVLASPQASPTAGATDWQLEYQRQGGIAGLMDLLVVDSRGNCTLTRRQQATRCTTTLEFRQALRAQLDQSSLLTLRSADTPMPCCDHFSYALHYRAGNAENSFRFDDTSIPPAVQPILVTLDGFLKSAVTP